jgi:ribosomal protein S18 acetylase RimI-like enzyme
MQENTPATIRRAVSADAPALAELGAATFVESFGRLYAPQDLAEFLGRNHSAAAYSRLLEDPTIAIWLAEVSGAPPVGYVVAGDCKLPVADLEEGAGEIRQLYVRSAFHGNNVGTKLLVIALDWLASRNRTPLYVGVWSQNYGAQRLYGRFGFEKVGEYEFAVGQQRDREFILRRTGLRSQG